VVISLVISPARRFYQGGCYMGVLRKLYAGFCKVELLLTGIGFVLLIALVFMSAILRLLKVSMSWNMDLAMLLLAWTAFLGADCAYRDGQLLGIDLVTRNLPGVVQKVIQILVFLVIFAALMFIVIFGVQLAQSEWARKFASIPIPFSVVTLSICVASASMIISTVIKIKNCIVNFNKTENSAAPEAAK
jgi:TRAP-type C4-dicarboxylate transport system permease small subunit